MLEVFVTLEVVRPKSYPRDFRADVTIGALQGIPISLAPGIDVDLLADVDTSV